MLRPWRLLTFLLVHCFPTTVAFLFLLQTLFIPFPVTLYSLLLESQILTQLSLHLGLTSNVPSTIDQVNMKQFTILNTKHKTWHRRGKQQMFREWTNENKNLGFLFPISPTSTTSLCSYSVFLKHSSYQVTKAITYQYHVNKIKTPQLGIQTIPTWGLLPSPPPYLP